MSKYIAYIESPLQAFNLIELLDTKKITIDLLIVNKKTTNSLLNYKQIMNVISMVRHRVLVTIDIEGTLRNSFKIKRELKKIKFRFSINDKVTLIAGEYRSRVFWFLAAKFKNRDIILLDDGTATLRISREGGFSLRKVVKSMFLKVIGMVSNEYEKITFFSVYNIEGKISENDNIIMHDYENYRKKIKSLPKNENKTFIIGSPLFEAGVTSVDDIELTINMINDLISKQPYCSFYYVPHRRERDKKIERISELVEIKRFDFPFEVYPLIEKENVSSIAGFYSSLYDNLIMIYGENIKITSYIIDADKISPEWKAFVGSIYDNYTKYKNANIELINKML